jgi:LysR family transcriptional regulator for bpeEF and oprC
MDRLQAMRVFTTVAEFGSFTRAAGALELSRARASEAVSELERALGTQLLHRTTRRVVLSEQGRVYYERARQILLDLDDAEALVLGRKAPLRGVVRVGMPMALARSMVLPALPRLLAKHPELALEVRLENRSVQLLEDGLDCALSYGRPNDENLIAQLVMPTRLVTLASPRYLAKWGTPKLPADLAQHNSVGFLAPATARPAAWAFIESGARVLRRPRGNVAFNSMEACVEAAVAGLGVTQVLSSLVGRAVQDKALRVVLAGFAAEGPGIFVVYPPVAGKSARLRVVVEFLTESMRAGSVQALHD